MGVSASSDRHGFSFPTYWPVKEKGRKGVGGNVIPPRPGEERKQKKIPYHSCPYASPAVKKEGGGL